MAGAPGRGYNPPQQQQYQSYQPYQQSPQRQYQYESISPIEGPNSPQSDPMSIPQPPAFRNAQPAYSNNSHQNMQNQRQYGSTSPQSGAGTYSSSGITPGSDNLGPAAAGGGVAGVAMGVANTHERESGVQALRDIDNWGRNGNGIAGPRGPPLARDQTASPFDYYAVESPTPPRPIHHQQQPQHSYQSTVPLASGALTSAGAMQDSEHTSASERSVPLDGAGAPMIAQSPYTYRDSPYNINRYSSSNLELGPGINPEELPDNDDDWGMAEPTTQQKRRSFNPFHSVSREGTPSSSGVAIGAAAGGVSASALHVRDPSGKYNAVPATESSPERHLTEKSEWLAQETTRNKRLRWIVGTIIAVLVIAAIVGGVLGGILGRKNNDKNKVSGGGSGGGEATAEHVAADNKNDLDKNSKEIQALLNNDNLHKVFPGMDYTPLNVQYPECMHVPPSQNNITRDMAVLSQLTNAVRLYGTDCNQTEMVLHAIDRLELPDMKVWLGVWIGDNETTNARQLDQLWNIVDSYDAARFKGVIVGNEVLFRKDITEPELATIIRSVKQNLTERGIALPIATSDLGDNWTADLAGEVDIVMSNIHPFFAGVTAEEATSWTWSFWQNKDVVLTSGDFTGRNTKQIISEVGWPSEGGNSCGQLACATDTEGSVAGVQEMNTFMEDWVCASLRNETVYFWYVGLEQHSLISPAPWNVS